MDSINPGLNNIDDCLYRVAIRVLVVQEGKVLLIKETDDDWWALPGGVDHGETVESTLTREVEEELGVPADKVSSDFDIVYYNIGSVVNGIPRMNLFFKATVPEALLRETEHAAAYQWFTKDEFLAQELHASYDKHALAKAIWNKA